MDITTDGNNADSTRNPQSATRDRVDWLSLVLQTSDPLFPTGAYAHSLGLEEAVRLGVVRDGATLSDFLRKQIIPALAHLELPYLRFLREAALMGNVEELCALDDEIGAWKLCRELREASQQFGTRRMRILSQIAPSEVLTRFYSQRPIAHHLTVCGMQMITVPLEAALATYSYQSLSGFCGASLKLIRIGQEACQRVLREALLTLPAAIEHSLYVRREGAGWFNPALEIASMRHETAWERLFIS